METRRENGKNTTISINDKMAKMLPQQPRPSSVAAAISPSVKHTESVVKIDCARTLLMYLLHKKNGIDEVS